MVPPTSNARKLVKEDEVEVHLLAVKKDYRNNNLGHRLLSELILQAQNEGYKKIILWTQGSMAAAQYLYSFVFPVYKGLCGISSYSTLLASKGASMKYLILVLVFTSPLAFAENWSISSYFM
nr:GNAT family N-acetyltransferase [Moritella sp. JT01]